MPTFNEIACGEGTPTICGEAMRDYLINCRMLSAQDIWNTGIVARTNRGDEFARSCHKSAAYNAWLPPEYSDTAIPICGDEGQTGCEVIGLKQTQETLFKLYANRKYGMQYCETQCMACDDEDPLSIMINNVVGPQMVELNAVSLLSQLTGLYAYAEAEGLDIVLDLGDECLNECHAVDIECMRECGTYDAIFVHKDVHNRMRKDGCLQQKACCGDSDFMFGAMNDGTVVIPVKKYWADKFLKDADGCYISYAFNFGAFEYGEGCHPKPFQRWEDPDANNCDGAEFAYFRREYLLRPFGTEFDVTGLAADYANVTELADGTRWNITAPLENFKIGFIKSCCA